MKLEKVLTMLLVLDLRLRSSKHKSSHGIYVTSPEEVVDYFLKIF